MSGHMGLHIRHKHACSMAQQQKFELSLNLMCFVILSEMLSTALVDILRNKSKVHVCIHKCYNMPHDFFWIFRMQFEMLSLIYVSWTPIYHTGYSLAINSYNRIP